jgi:hypothetical protein
MGAPLAVDKPIRETAAVLPIRGHVLEGITFLKATAKIADDVEELLAFFGYLAEHWVHLAPGPFRQ